MKQSDAFHVKPASADNGDAADAAAGIEPEPAFAADVFGDRLDLARRYVGQLATTGVTRGLVGPREVPRLWTRHVLNCAVLAEVIDDGATVLDLGSGAGLPGLPVALARPDLEVTLLEPMQRRCDWLTEVIEDLRLDRVRVVRGRAEDVAGTLSADVVCSRAVAALPKLLAWSLPLAATGGMVAALKGERAQAEVAENSAELARRGIREVNVVLCGEASPAGPTRVVTVKKPAGWSPRPARGSKNRRGGR